MSTPTLTSNLTATRPYLVRAMHEWMSDNNLTPFLLVDAFVEGVEVPQAYVKNGRIVLNIASSAVRDLQLHLEFVAFTAKFSGIVYEIYVPIQAILAVYAQENNRGIFFEQDGDIQPPPDKPRLRKEGNLKAVSSVTSLNKKLKPRPNLKVVK
jgi:stringent starvation protein B